MKIKLDEPFESKWKFGYIVTNSENRRNVVLFNSSKDRTTVSYARYLMSVSLGRFLEKTEHVDHIDNDKTNDTLENLQILLPAENSKKQGDFIGKTFMLGYCPQCQLEFLKSLNTTQAVDSHNGKISHCSRQCAGKIRSILDEELRSFISEEQVFRIVKKHGNKLVLI